MEKTKAKAVKVKDVRQAILNELSKQTPGTPEYNQLMELFIKLEHERNEEVTNYLKSIGGIVIPVLGMIVSIGGTLFCTKWEDGSIMTGTAGKKHMNNLFSWTK